MYYARLCCEGVKRAFRKIKMRRYSLSFYCLGCSRLQIRIFVHTPSIMHMALYQGRLFVFCTTSKTVSPVAGKDQVCLVIIVIPTLVIR